MQYRNHGAPFSREDGTRWERDQVAEPTARELARRRYKLRPASADEVRWAFYLDAAAAPEVSPALEEKRAARQAQHARVVAASAAEAVEAELDAAAEAVVVGVSDWKLRMPPATYLRLHPEGIHADEARTLTDTVEDSTPSEEEPVSDDDNKNE